jgi:hypothetical protein
MHILPFTRDKVHLFQVNATVFIFVPVFPGSDDDAAFHVFGAAGEINPGRDTYPDDIGSRKLFILECQIR